MDTFADTGTAIDAIVRFDREKFSTLPDEVQAEMTRLAGLGVSPVDRVVRTAEALYAVRDKLTRNADRLLVAQLVEFARRNGWHRDGPFGLEIDERGTRIQAIMQLAAGEDAPEVAEEDVPEGRPEFLPPEAPPAEPAP